MVAKVADLVLIYSFLKRLTTPFDKTEAYKLGIIDKDGKRIKSKEVKTTEEQNAELINSEYPEVLRPNSLSDYFNHPEWYTEPRQIQIGMELKW